jgi:ribonucleoside-diphosphate reductase beta chain
MYASIYSGTEPTTSDLLEAFAANQILEEQVFPGGFAAMYSIGGKMVGSAKMIAFIHRDEEGSHVPLFKNIFRTTVSENPEALNQDTIDHITKMIIDMCIAEQRWTKYATKGVLGFSDEAIRILSEHQANSVAKNLGIPLPYSKTDGGPLAYLLNKYSMLKSDTKTNFFESKPADYSVGSLDMGDL